MSTTTEYPTISPDQLNAMLDRDPTDLWLVEIIETNLQGAHAHFHHLNLHAMGVDEPLFRLEFNSLNRMGIWLHVITHRGNTPARLQAGRRYDHNLRVYIDCKYVNA